MKLHISTEQIERVGVQSESSFTIKTTAKAFDILSSGLYSDPIAAIIRELSCNAYDSHIAAHKKDVPFQIHLPNALEPYISIIDFGIGLSDADVIHLYTTYFESTKSDSNDFVGALGLGSKSPFGYTKSYEVISKFEGNERSYHMFINEHGIPDVARMNSRPTNDGNGIEVKIGVAPEDFNKFISRTGSVLKHFDVKPTIVGALHFKFDPLPMNNITGKNWMVFNANQSHYKTKFTAIQGGVQYKVDIDQFRDELTYNELRVLTDIHAVSFFEMGTIEFAPSREEIRYNKQTVSAVICRLREILKSLTDQILVQCINNVTFWDASIKLQQLSNSAFSNRYTLATLMRTQDITNLVLQRYMENDGEVVLPDNLVSHMVTSYTIASTWGEQKTKRSTVSTGLLPSPSIRFVLNDIPRGGIARITESLKSDDSIGQIIVITDLQRAFTSDEDIELYKNHPQEEYDKIVAAFGNPTITTVSETCPVVIKEKRELVLKTFNCGDVSWTGQGRRLNWYSNICDPDEPTLYFVLKSGRDITAKYKTKHETHIEWPLANVSTNLDRLVQYMNDKIGEDKYDSDNIVGVSVATWRHIRSNPNWINVLDLALDDNHTQLMHYINMKDRIYKTTNLYDLMAVVQNQENRDLIRTLPTTSTFRKTLTAVMDDWDQLNNMSHDDYDFFFNLDKMVYGINKTVDSKPYFNYNKLSKYPMFSILGQVPKLPTQFSYIVDYVRMVDNKNKKIRRLELKL